ncbi:hypothetical protein [Actinoplanes siamensis]|uniref:hypothetical protein n=1 Tax=Actinoplanes siamensis TaxID=1223317 RepID=UPI0019405B39|nr:hypothetical protein [Actinoplanes siamensis]
MAAIYSDGVLTGWREHHVAKSRSQNAGLMGAYAILLAVGGCVLVGDFFSADRDWWDIGFHLLMVSFWAGALVKEIRLPTAGPAS